MKVLCWNVNGLLRCIDKGFHKVIKEQEPDIICLQETKSKSAADLVELDNYKKYYNFANRNGLWGVAIFTKTEPLDIIKWKDDREGRVLIAEFKDFYLINLYVMNSGTGLKRLDERLEWDVELRKYIKSLKKKVIVCGDMNVVHKDIDIWKKKMDKKVAGCSDEERKSFSKLLDECHLIDMFRYLYPDDLGYSYYSIYLKNWNPDKGWRLDYVLTTDKTLIKDVKTLPEHYRLSDHIPLTFEILNKENKL